jgi:transcriptional regulator with XRE-family HTH domain
MEANKIHIGKLIQDVVKQKKVKPVDLANQLGKTRQNIYDLYSRDSVDVKLLLELSKALNYDFVSLFTLSEKSIESDTEVSISLKIKSDQLEDVLKWFSDKGSLNISKK